MKIGILTFQRAENYGAMLQAYALKRFLEKNGHEVSFVDYWPGYHAKYFRLFSPYFFLRRSFIGKIYHLVLLFWSFLWMKKRQKNFHWFMWQYLRLEREPEYTDRAAICDKYDAVLYGSDQIWRKHPFPDFKGFDEWYFGAEQIRASKKIVFAASMGAIDIKEEDKTFLKKNLRNFDHISVREFDLKNFLEELNFPVAQVSDPVFLLEKEEWGKLIEKEKQKKNQPYILFYNLLNTNESLELASKIEAKTGVKIKEICKVKNFKTTGSDYIKSAGVEEFLALVRDAEMVLSNSFHGVAMSVIFQKQFFALGMKQKANRVLSLLDSLQIKDRYLDNATSEIPDSVIDYAEVEANIRAIKKQSADFLDEALNEGAQKVKK